MKNEHWENNKDWLISLLACPDCGQELTYDQSGFNISHMDGVLSCKNCGVFPVIAGIPRLLPEKYLHIYLARYYPQILQILPPPKTSKHLGKIDKEQDIVTRTMFSFGYQWNTFDNDHIIWDNEYERCMSPLRKEHLTSHHIVADFGCGMGRMIYRASKEKARFVGIDLSNAIESASLLCKNRNNVIFVQGDILNPPFKKGSFDTIYSVGVLHHLPDGISKGITILIKLLKQGGFLHTWLYGAQRGDNKKSLVMMIRKAIKNLPLKCIYVFSYLYAFFVLIFINIPATILSKINVLDAFVKKFPFPSWRNMNLNAIACNVFDYYATPIEWGYDKRNLEQEIKKHSQINWEIKSLSTPLRSDESWHLYGFKL